MANQQHLKVLKRGLIAWNKWRKANPEVTPDLTDASLERIDLGGRSVLTSARSEANWSMGSYPIYHSVNLCGANLSRADLDSANLHSADLRGANLDGAILVGADLSDADLSDATLRGAHLIAVNFTDAKFHNTQFVSAVIGETTFARSDLRGIVGLEYLQWLKPSYIDIDTMLSSWGGLPEVFLRGVGIPESFIIHMPSLIESMQPIQFYSCFISYSHADKSFARRLHDGLQGQGIRCWLDEHQVLPGQKIYTEVDRGIRLWDKVLLCCSKDSLKSWWVENEIQIAFDKEQQLKKQRGGEEVLALIPLNLDGYLFGDEWKSGLRTEIKSRLAADFTGWETDNAKSEAAFERLVKALRADAGGRERPPVSRL
jgi:uncharacterized protein YjbI with pentapeptide repeats